MKKSEIIKANYASILEAMKEHYETVVRSYGRCQYQIYVWEDGEIECLQGPQGDNSWLKPKDAEPRMLYYVCTVGGQYIDPWDFADHGAPDDQDEREKEEEEIFSWLIEEYDHEGAEAALDAAIDEAEEEERYM